LHEVSRSSSSSIAVGSTGLLGRSSAAENVPKRSDVSLSSSRGNTGLLSIGTVCAGVFAYAFNVLAARALGPKAYGPVATLWAAIFISAVVLFRPLEQTLSRNIAERSAQGVDSLPVVHAVVRLAVCICAVALIACALAWEPLTNGLFAGQAVLTAALALATVGYGCSYVMRGMVGGVRWYGGYGLQLFADGAVRIVVALPLFVIASPAIAGAALVAASISGALVPLSRRRRLREGLTGSRKREFHIGHALRFAAPVTAGAAAEQILVSGGPLLIMLTGGAGAAAAAGAVFAATMLVRAPVFLFQGVAAALLPSLARLDALGDVRAFRSALLRTTLIVALFAGLLVAGALAVGPAVMRALFGPGFDASREDLAMLCAGIGCYLLAATLSQAVLASGRARAAGTAWTLSAVAFIALELTLSGSPLHKVSLAFLSASVLMALLFAAIVARLRPGRSGSTGARTDASEEATPRMTVGA
jgi:O-antigen/teichoic acid export membrane protein